MYRPKHFPVLSNFYFSYAERGALKRQLEEMIAKKDGFAIEDCATLPDTVEPLALNSIENEGFAIEDCTTQQDTTHSPIEDEENAVQDLTVSQLIDNVEIVIEDTISQEDIRNLAITQFDPSQEDSFCISMPQMQSFIEDELMIEGEDSSDQRMLETDCNIEDLHVLGHVAKQSAAQFSEGICFDRTTTSEVPVENNPEWFEKEATEVEEAVWESDSSMSLFGLNWEEDVCFNRSSFESELCLEPEMESEMQLRGESGTVSNTELGGDLEGKFVFSVVLCETDFKNLTK